MNNDKLSSNGINDLNKKSVNNYKVTIDEVTKNDKPKNNERKLYKADSVPPILLTFFFGLQQVMVSVSVLVSISFLITDLVCPGQDIYQLRVRLISATFFVCGIATILQTLVGFRLALLQGVALAYIPSVEAFMSLPENHCNSNITDYVSPEIYENKLSLMQGTLLLSSTITIIIGATGLVGKMTKFIGPLTVSSLMIMLMYSGVKLCVERMEKHWISLISLIILFAVVLYFSNIRVPFPAYSNGKFKLIYLNIFNQYPYLITIAISWFLCFILTVFDFVPLDSAVRTNREMTIATIRNSKLFSFPTIGQFGMPKINFGLFVGFLVSAQTTLFEAVGNYHAVARVSEERPPPSHAINRGILFEGLGCFISGLIGPGVGITTHAENVGVIGITRVASRVTMVFGGCILILFGFCTKLGALLSSIPDPLVGVVLSSSMAMVGGISIANCQAADMKKTRNVAIIGFSIMMGFCVPKFYERNSSKIIIENKNVDQVIKVLLSLPMFVSAFTACILDNTVGGATRTERGLRERGLIHDLGLNKRDIYAYSPAIMNFINKFTILKILPFMPRKKVATRSNTISTTTTTE